MELQESCKHRMDEALSSHNHVREGMWTESIAVGSEGFVEATREKLRIRAKGRRVFEEDGTYQLREPAKPYKGHFDLENSVLSLENTYFGETNL